MPHASTNATSPCGRFTDDLARYLSKSYAGHRLWLEPALWAIGTHRLGNPLYVNPPNPLLRLPLKATWFAANKFCQIGMEMDTDEQATNGSGLYIGTGAALVGKIRIRSGAKTAANTLVISNVPAGASVMGVPARIIMQPPKQVAAASPFVVAEPLAPTADVTTVAITNAATSTTEAKRA